MAVFPPVFSLYAKAGLLLIVFIQQDLSDVNFFAERVFYFNCKGTHLKLKKGSDSVQKQSITTSI